MNIYRVTTDQTTFYRAAAPTLLDVMLADRTPKGHTVETVEIVSTDHNCAGCGDSWNDHFNGFGLCSLGFCRKGCGSFVASE